MAVCCLPVAFAAESPVFDRDIQPIVEKRCTVCHGAETPQGGLDLRTPPTMLRGGKSGPAIVVGSSAKSLLIEKIVSGAMPPGGKLDGTEIETIRSWIDGGARLDASSDETEASTLVAVTARDVLPMFQLRCVICHGKRKQEGGLDLRTHEGWLKGGNSGPGIIPGDPDQSLIVRRIESGEMPPPDLQFQNSVRPPTEAELGALRKFIQEGAPAAPPRHEEAEASSVTDKDRAFWSFVTPTRREPPPVKSTDLVRNPIDAFLLAKFESEDLTYSPEAPKLELMRRAYLDLIGLPPTPMEVEEYMRDDREDAYEQLVDRLLESPFYGERWARYWLDLAGYSDSEGAGAHDPVRPFAWRYRDYVIRSLNADKPYSQFITEQIAGDELGDYRSEPVTKELIDRLAATGFLRTTPDSTDLPELAFIGERATVLSDTIEVLTSSVMGLTVGCARCHDHKYDPIPQRDYYRLSAVLQTAYDPYDWVPPKGRKLEIAFEDKKREVEEHNGPIEAQIKKLESQKPDPERVKEDPDEKEKAAALDRQVAALKKDLLPMPYVRALTDTGGEPSPAYVFRRGDPLAPGEEVEPGVPSVLKVGLEPYQVETPWSGAPSSGRRLALARWLTQPNHPLTSRVAVNHIWAKHFGRGLVASLSNFGRSGTPPSHPALLDWLATEFVRSGWKMKTMHRLIMTSTAYRQASRADDALLSADPDNVLLARMPMRRMDAEALYDSILRASGHLDPTPFGPPSEVEKNDLEEVIAKGTDKGYRRSIYVQQRRFLPLTMHEVFDLPPMTPNCIERGQSTVAPQALALMNGSVVWRHARYMAGRIVDAVGDDLEQQVRRVYLTALSRPPTEDELRQGQTALRELYPLWEENLAERIDEAPRSNKAHWMALASFCQSILSSAEFSYVD